MPQQLINEQTRRPITPTEWKRVIQRDSEMTERFDPEDRRFLAERLDQRDLVESNTVFWKEW